MKKLMMILIAMTTLPTHAADVNEICKRNTLVMIILHNEAEPTDDPVIDSVARTWRVNFDYDLFAGAHPDRKTANYIAGSTTCNAKNQRSSDDGLTKEAGPAYPGDTNTFLKAAPADEGVNCWCKMDGPVTSWWTYFKKYDSEQDCADYCTTFCATNFANGYVNTDTGYTGPNIGQNASGETVYGRYALFNKIW